MQPPSGSAAAERAALAAVDRDELVDTLASLVAIPSVTGSAQEAAAQRWLAARAAGLGLDVDLWQVDLAEVSADPGFPGTEAPRDEAWGLVATWPVAGAPATLALNGHVDVVPPGDESAWTTAPFLPDVRERADGRLALFGRGACDMKAGLACNLQVVAALRRAGLEPPLTLALHSVVGEEDGGLGTFATLRRGHRADAVVITEPTGLAVVPANAGALTFRLTVRGLATHGSTRLAGVSALDKLWPVRAALARLESERNAGVPPPMDHLDLPYPLSIGTVRAGNWPSSVPDRLVAEGRYGVRLGEEPQAARDAFEAAVGAACEGDPWLALHPVEVEWYGGQFASGSVPLDAPLTRLVVEARTDLTGSAPPVQGAPYGSDLRLYVGAGIPAVQFGPGHIRDAHGADEHVLLDDLVRATETLLLVVLRAGALTGRSLS